MSRFLALSKRIINPRYIRQIYVEENEYIIDLITKQTFSGIMVSGALAGFGFIGNEKDSESKLLSITRYDEKGEINKDFEIVTNFFLSENYNK